MLFNDYITLKPIPINSIRQSRSCFNYYRIEWTKESLSKALLISNYKLKRIFFGWKELRNSTSIEKHYQLICNSLSENFYRSRDIGGLLLISVIKTSRPFKLNIIFHRAWKKKKKKANMNHKKQHFFRHKRAMTLQKAKTNSLFFIGNMNSPLAFAIWFSPSHNSATQECRGNGNFMLYLTPHIMPLELLEKCFVVTAQFDKMLFKKGRDFLYAWKKYCIIVGKMQMVSGWKNNNCLSLKIWTIDNKAIYCAWTQNNVEYLVLIFFNRLSVDHLHRNVNCLTSHSWEWCFQPLCLRDWDLFAFLSFSFFAKNLIS